MTQLIAGLERNCQCDQMVILHIQYLAIYSNEHLLNTIKMAKVGSKFCQIWMKHSNNMPNILKCSPKWQNFAKYGHNETVLLSTFPIENYLDQLL